MAVQTVTLDMQSTMVQAREASPFVSLEHLNLNVPSWTQELEKFWFDALGFVRDPRAETVFQGIQRTGGTASGLVWANIGLQQIHMPLGEPENPSQRGRGELGLGYADLNELTKRLECHSIPCEEVEKQGPFPAGIRFESPTGVRLRAQQVTQPLLGPTEAIAAPSSVGLPGGPSLGIGLVYAEFVCGVGVAAAICRFYEQVLVVPAVAADGVCVVPLQDQSLIFREVSGEVEPYDGHHVAVYVGNISKGDTVESFKAMYCRSKEAGLVWNNPRFPMFTYDTLEDAVRFNEFRVKDLVDPLTGKVVYELEHEIRSLAHPGFSCKALLPEKK